MKKLTAEEFAEKVMENGTEMEYNEYISKDRGCQVWEIYAHIDKNGEVINHCGSGIKSNYVLFELENQEQSDAFMNGKLDDIEKKLIEDELYPWYLDVTNEL